MNEWMSRFLASSVAIGCALVSVARAQLTVTAIDPPINASNREPNTSIVVDFDRAVSAGTLASFAVYGSSGGPALGTRTLENGGLRLRFTPARPFFAGEVVRVEMSHDLQAMDGSFLRSAGYVTHFRVKTRPSSMTFTTIASFFSDPVVFTRIYGSEVCDLDQDHYIDLEVISEVTADVRVFRSLADASGAFTPLPISITSVAAEPSPNENADMNGDGLIDLVVCDVGASSVSILLGNGDGTFQPAATYSMNNDPHGMALLDVDGDGDIDVVTAGYGSNDLAMRRNNGNGTLGPVTFFEGGGNGEWGLTAADMDGDGIEDLVVGMQNEQTIVVQHGNGNGTFTQRPAQFAGGSAWMVVCGDVNNDGRMDVSVANSGSATGAILLGNGDGTLQAPQIVATSGHTVSSRLGDLDGDGDLDWILSIFGGQEWRVYRNDNGVMHYLVSFPSSANPACAALCDIDDDGDLDIVLLTETSDEIVIKENGVLDARTYCYGTAAACPCGNAGAAGHGCEHSFDLGGGLLNAQGRASVAGDTLALAAGDLPATASTLFFQGDVQIAGGAGSVFGDGLRCAGGTVIRLATRTAVNGWTTYGSGNLGDMPISQRGMIPPAGATRFYQAWYRNAASFCTASTFNLTNGVRVVWTP